MKYKMKVKCYTPKGKAVKCEKEWRKQFPSFKKPDEVKVVNDSEFYWIYSFDKEKDMYNFQKKVLLVEPGIRKMYSFMIKFFTRANKLMNKSAWTVKKVKNWLVKRWKKTFENKPDQEKGTDQATIIEKMDEQQFKEYIKIEDLEEMQKFLDKKELITTEYLAEGNK